MKFVATYSEHLARYVFAMQHCYKRTVLDAGGKDGDCSMLLTYGARELTIADISPHWLDCAKVNHSYKCPTKFVLCDFDKEFPEGKWDCITAFEVIEHVTDPDFFVKNISEHLNEGGSLVFSVPHMIANPEHKTLFDEQKIKDLISKYLTITEFYIQDKRVISGLKPYKGLKNYVGVAQKK